MNPSANHAATTNATPATIEILGAETATDEGGRRVAVSRVRSCGITRSTTKSMMIGSES